MSEQRTYAIIELPHTALEHSKAICFCNGERFRLDGNALLVKTKQSTIDKYKVDNPSVTDAMLFPPGKTTYYTYEQVKIILSQVEWSTPFDET